MVPKVFQVVKMPFWVLNQRTVFFTNDRVKEIIKKKSPLGPRTLTFYPKVGLNKITSHFRKANSS